MVREIKSFGIVWPNIFQSTAIITLTIFFLSATANQENSPEMESSIFLRHHGDKPKEFVTKFNSKNDRSALFDVITTDQIGNPEKSKQKRKFRRSENIQLSKNLKNSYNDVKQNDIRIKPHTEIIIDVDVDRMHSIINPFHQRIVSTEVNNPGQRSNDQESGHVRRRHAKNRKRRSPAWLMNTYMLLCETGLDPKCQKLNNSTHTAHEY